MSMSIRGNMKPIALQIKKSTRSKTGSTKVTWEDVKNIEVSIFKTDSTMNTTNARYNESSHIGLTSEEGIIKGKYRLKEDETIYNITDVTPGRLNVLLLKVIENAE